MFEVQPNPGVVECPRSREEAGTSGPASIKIPYSKCRVYFRRSYRSSKNKRKHERKLLSLKEGSPYEDLALVRALHELFSKLYAYRGLLLISRAISKPNFVCFTDEVKSLCTALLHFGLDEEATSVQNKLSTLLKDTESKKSDIWIPELAQNRAAALAVQFNFYKIFLWLICFLQL